MENPTAITPPLKETCASCGAKLKGNYCRKCGEKKIIPERDFRISKFLSQTLWHFVRFDSKLARSSWLLFSRPGFLTAEWIAGRRVNYMKPLQLFVVAALVFYFFLPNVPAYFTNSRDLIIAYQEGIRGRNTFHYDFGKELTQKALNYGVDEKVFSESIDSKAAQQSKTWLFFIIPFWGTLVYLFFHKKIPWLAPHLIFAVNGLTFYLLADLMIHAFLAIFNIPQVGGYIFLALMGLYFFYQLLAIRRVYSRSWLETILKTMGIVAGFIIIILLYKQIITIATLITY